MRKAPTRNHKTEEIAVSTAEIDKGIIPLIKWLNTFKGVATQFCCEGSTKKQIKDGHKDYDSYVLFTCCEQWSLMQILEKFTNFANLYPARCEVAFRPSLAYPIRYDMRFQNKETLNEFQKYLDTDVLVPPKRTKEEEIALYEGILEEVKAE